MYITHLDHEICESIHEIVQSYENKNQESINNSWFIVDFDDDTIMDWGSKEDMTKALDKLMYEGPILVSYKDFTLKMIESISISLGRLCYDKDIKKIMNKNN